MVTDRHNNICQLKKLPNRTNGDELYHGKQFYRDLDALTKKKKGERKKKPTETKKPTGLANNFFLIVMRV